MGKVAGAMVGVFTVGGGLMTLLGSLLGTRAEAVTLALVGVGLLASSSLLGSKVAATTGMAEEA